MYRGRPGPETRRKGEMGSGSFRSRAVAKLAPRHGRRAWAGPPLLPQRLRGDLVGVARQLRRGEAAGERRLHLRLAALVEAAPAAERGQQPGGNLRVEGERKSVV